MVRQAGDGGSNKNPLLRQIGVCSGDEDQYEAVHQAEEDGRLELGRIPLPGHLIGLAAGTQRIQQGQDSHQGHQSQQGRSCDQQESRRDHGDFDHHADEDDHRGDHDGDTGRPNASCRVGALSRE